ncbi:MAG: hypothetical protein JWM19_6964 [Actinomycetia bacterium]|nr:hypothetical protein [Actinomycetes bacterium]
MGKFRLLVVVLAGWAVLLAGMASPAEAVSAAVASSDCAPVLTSVSSVQAERTQTVTLTGSCLGTSPAQSDGDVSYLRLTDLSTNPDWNGCHEGAGDSDSVGCAITSWTDTSITFAGYAGSYGGGWSLSRGDDLAFMVWNPQTGTGPGFCRVTVGSPGTTDCPVTPPAQVTLSTSAAHATGVTYTAQFKAPSAGLTEGTSQLTLTAPAGTVLSGQINAAYNVTTGTDLGGARVFASGNTMAWTSGASVPGGDVVLLVLTGETNPGAGSGKLQVTMSQPSGSADLPYTVTAARPVASVAVAPAQPAIGGAGTQYTVQFTASSSGALVNGEGQFTLTAPSGTVLPSTISDVYDVTSGLDLGPWYNGALSAGGSQGTWTAQSGMLAGDELDLTLDDVTNPGAGSYQLSLGTSSDAAAKTAAYSVLAPAAVPQISGTVTYDNNGTPTAVVGSVVQACSGSTCVSGATPTDGNGDYSLYVPSAGTYTVTAFAPTSNAYSLGEGSASPAAITAAGPNTVNVTLPALAPLPAGVTLDGQSGTVGDVFWGSPVPMSVTGCADGAGMAMVTATNTQTGATTLESGPLTESPAGSGTYNATTPALYPAHGTASAQTAISCYTPSALLPSDGPDTGGNGVEISGTGFTGATAVKFGGVKAESFTVVSDSEIDAVAPPGSGTVVVTVDTPRGTIADATLATYTYLTVSALSPDSGPAAGGTTVTIIGSELGQAQAVYFGDVPATNVTVDSATQITATAPAGTGTVPVTVLTADGGVSATTAPLFSYGTSASSAAPASPAQSTQPTAIAAALTTPVPLSGQGPAGQQRAGGVVGAVGNFAVGKAEDKMWNQADKVIEYTANRCSQGMGFTQALDWALTDYRQNNIGVITQEDLQGQRNWNEFVGTVQSVYYQNGAGAAQAGDFLLHFLGQYGVSYFQNVGNATVAGACFLKEAPQDVVDGYYKTKNAIQSFLFHIDPSGTVEDTNGNLISGATVTLLQSPDKLGPFTAPPAGSPLMVPSVNPETTGGNGAFHWDALAGYYEITASKRDCYQPGHPSVASVVTPVFQLPPPKVGIVLTLQCAGEKKPASPTVTGLSVTSGPGTGGSTVDVTGAGFTSGAVVRFGTAKATGVSVLGSTDIQVTTPRGSGTVSVTVTTAGGTSVATAKDRFSYIPGPTVTSISPARGPARGGTKVTITGKGFSAGDEVSFGQKAAGTVTVVSATRIIATSPAGAGTVAVTVTSVDGPSHVTAAAEFSYAGKPAFSSAAALTATKGTKFSFTVTAGGYPAPALTESGHLPPGVTFTAHKGGTATIGGTPTRAGRYTLSIGARNGYGTATQVLVMTVKS